MLAIIWRVRKTNKWWKKCCSFSARLACWYMVIIVFPFQWCSHGAPMIAPFGPCSQYTSSKWECLLRQSCSGNVSPETIFRGDYPDVGTGALHKCLQCAQGACWHVSLGCVELEVSGVDATAAEPRHTRFERWDPRLSSRVDGLSPLILTTIDMA